jgi:hypothetical protein
LILYLKGKSIQAAFDWRTDFDKRNFLQSLAYQNEGGATTGEKAV